MESKSARDFAIAKRLFAAGSLFVDDFGISGETLGRQTVRIAQAFLTFPSAAFKLSRY
jgi:hypothetical protein